MNRQTATSAPILMVNTSHVTKTQINEARQCCPPIECELGVGVCPVCIP